MRIASPSDWAYVGGTCRISVEVSHEPGIDYVAVYADDRLIGTLTRAPYRLDWKTAEEIEGPHALSAKAVGKDLREASTPRRTVVIDRQPPQVRLGAPFDGGTVVGLVAVEAEAEDRFGIRDVKLLLDGSEVQSTPDRPYRFTWDTREIPNGHRTLQIRAIDLAGNAATSDEATVWVANPSAPPELAPIGSRTILEGAAWSLEMQAADPDGARDPLTFSAVNLPPWATLDTRTGRLSGTPGYDEAASEKPLKPYLGVELSVCDPEPLCVSETISLNVMNANRPPSFAPLGDQSVDEQGVLVIRPNPADPDGEALACRMEALPRWMRFDQDLCVARGMPLDDQDDLTEPTTIYEGVKLVVCDPEPVCVNETFTITVTNVGDSPPAFTMPLEATVREGQILSLEITAEDPEQDTLILQTIGLPDGSAFTDHGDGTGVFSWVPRYDQSGAYEATFKVSDASSGVAQTVRITVVEAALSISGLVIDVLGKPIQGTRIEFSREEHIVQTATTNEAGYYHATLEPGEYDLKPSHDLEGSYFGTATKQLKVVFNPPKARVILTTADRTDNNFIAVFPGQ